ncbi:hypothetical protein MJ1_0686 [Nanobdella aerobiophila]|uniref:Uncharacterized protein n=1 Tax=Nanobdella aerobiophila TaxID=2586965 RepID=A0A915T096_9ARCH|nr:hypothetical protein [Nanobdella aerobiophila]BBL45829.1 hypothetical protein MJ1_0686 [Nanobdella aerobiophila]
MVAKLLESIIIIGSTLLELYLLWDPNFFNNEVVKLGAGGVVALDILALLGILINI